MAVEGAPCCIFHDDGKMLVRQEALMEPDYVRVYQPGVIQELPLYILGHLILQSIEAVCHATEARMETTPYKSVQWWYMFW